MKIGEEAEELNAILQEARALEQAGDVSRACDGYRKFLDRATSRTGALIENTGAWATFRLIEISTDQAERTLRSERLVDYARRSNDPTIIEQAIDAAVQLGDPTEKKRTESADQWLEVAEELGLRRTTDRGFTLAFCAYGALAASRGWDIVMAHRYRTKAFVQAARLRSAEAASLAAMSGQFYAEALSSWPTSRAYRRALYVALLVALWLRDENGRAMAAAAAINLAAIYQPAGSWWRAEMALALAAKWGQSSGLPYGHELAAKACLCRGCIYRTGKRSFQQFERAIEHGQISATGKGLEYATAAALNLGSAMIARNRARGLKLYEAAMRLGATSETSSAVNYSLIAVERFADCLDPAGEVDRLAEAIESGIALADKTGAVAAGARLRERLTKIQSAAAEPAPATKGVVVIHGVGHPVEGQFMQNIVHSLGNWLSLNVPVRGSLIRPDVQTEQAADGRLFVVIRHGAQRWMITEAHWSEAITSPPFVETVRWSALHFFQYSTKLARDMVTKNLLPTIHGLARVGLAVAIVLIQLPVAIAAFPATPLVVWIARTASRRVWSSVVNGMEERTSDPMTRRADISAALQSWRRRTPNLVCIMALGVCATIIGVVGYTSDLYWRENWIWSAGLSVYLAMVLPIWFHNITKRIATDLWTDAGPVTLLNGAGIVTLSKYGLLNARLEATSILQAYRDSLHLIATMPATAALNAARQWLLLNNEFKLLRYAQWNNLSRGALSRIGISSVMGSLILFRLFNTMLAFVLYVIGSIAIFPVALLVWAISASSTTAASSLILERVKRRLDMALLGTVGDIYLFTHSGDQAAIIRDELKDSIDAIAARSDEVCVIAHSMGCAISFETLADEQNATLARKVRTLVTVGGILPMVWRMPRLRMAFAGRLPSHIRWLNLWARLDPAEGGPLPSAHMACDGRDVDAARAAASSSLLSFTKVGDPKPRTFQEVVVSNEDDVWRDHTTYWRNSQEVIPILVREIWGKGSSEPTANFDREEAVRAFRQRLRILCTSFPRMLAWYVFPLVAVAVWYDWNNPNALTNLGALEIGRMTLALAVGAGCSMIAHFFVWWLRRSLWERYLENLPIFSASVLPPSPLVGDMKGGTGTVIAIGLGEPLFQR